MVEADLRLTEPLSFRITPLDKRRIDRACELDSGPALQRVKPSDIVRAAIREYLSKRGIEVAG